METNVSSRLHLVHYAQRKELCLKRKRGAYFWVMTFPLVPVHYTDHQPLLELLGNYCSIPSLRAARIRGWAIMLAAYQYHLHSRNGKNMEVADALLWLPLPTKERKDKVECLAMFDATTLTARQVARGTK